MNKNIIPQFIQHNFKLMNIFILIIIDKSLNHDKRIKQAEKNTEETFQIKQIPNDPIQQVKLPRLSTD